MFDDVDDWVYPAMDMGGICERANIKQERKTVSSPEKWDESPVAMLIIEL